MLRACLSNSSCIKQTKAHTQVFLSCPCQCVSVWLQNLPSEPDAGDADIVQVAVRMPGGSRFTRRSVCCSAHADMFSNTHAGKGNHISLIFTWSQKSRCQLHLCDQTTKHCAVKVTVHWEHSDPTALKYGKDAYSVHIACKARSEHVTSVALHPFNVDLHPFCCITSSVQSKHVTKDRPLPCHQTQLQSHSVYLQVQVHRQAVKSL